MGGIQSTFLVPRIYGGEAALTNTTKYLDALLESDEKRALIITDSFTKLFVLIRERINNIKRIISCNLGLIRQDDKLPNIVLKPLNSGRTADVIVNLDENLESYYNERGWDWETGRLKDEKLTELGIK